MNLSFAIIPFSGIKILKRENHKSFLPQEAGEPREKVVCVRLIKQHSCILQLALNMAKQLRIQLCTPSSSPWKREISPGYKALITRACQTDEKLSWSITVMTQYNLHFQQTSGKACPYLACCTTVTDSLPYKANFYWNKY